MGKRKMYAVLLMVMLVLAPQEVFAMHIMEGFLPSVWCIVWGILTIPFIMAGYHSIRKTVDERPKTKLLLAMAGAFTFVLSALKLPSITGSCSHPTGIGFGAILFGPSAMAVLGLMVLLFQALLLAHGGLTTLGANTFSMAVVGPFAAYAVYKAVRAAKGPKWLAVFLGAAFGDLMTYVAAAIQLALAFPAETGGFMVSLMKFMSIFALTQLPLAISEGILTVLIFNSIPACSIGELGLLKELNREIQ